MNLLYYLSFYPVALGWRRSTLRLYSCGACSIDNWKMEKFFNSQLSIANCFGLTEEALSGRPSGALKNLGCLSRRRVFRDFSAATETVASGV